MTIVELWKTSQGIFTSKDEAMLKKNRARVIPDYRSAVSTTRELPVKIIALCDGDNYYQLNPIHIGGM